MSKSRAEVNNLFHGTVDIGSGNSAGFVVAHAQRQAQRGRKPAVQYRGITNPRAALEAAQADLETRASTDKPYVADFCGRVVLIRVVSDRQKDIAYQYAENLVEKSGAAGVIIKDVMNGETLQAPLHYRITAHDTVELLIPF